MLDHAERDVRREGAVANAELAEVHGGQRRVGHPGAAGTERVQRPVDADRLPSLLPQQDHVLAEAAPRLEHRRRRRRQRAEDERRQRRHLGHAGQRLRGLAAPVLRPERPGRGPRVVRERHPRAPSARSSSISRSSADRRS